MSKELELWGFIAERLERGEQVMLLVVAESSGSSPGRAGYKMAVASDGEMIGSIGGGVMEVNLVEQAKTLLSTCVESWTLSQVSKQIHRKNTDQPSGMICSGEQTVILRRLNRHFLPQILKATRPGFRLAITEGSMSIEQPGEGEARQHGILFLPLGEGRFLYRESVGAAHDLYIIGGGHCALALSEMMSRMGFRIHIFDDRPSLNTLDKNEFAEDITIIDGYDNIADRIPNGGDMYVVVMTLGYASDAIVIRQLAGRSFKYFGVLGSKAKMATLMKELRAEGYSKGQLAAIRTPVGLPINSHTPEEIAVSIAAEIISVKNAHPSFGA